MATPLPADFDVSTYIKSSPDLARLSPLAALEHFQTYGRFEGRICNAISSRDRFLDLVPKRKPLLEIGPYTAPAFRRPTHQVRYLDAFTADEMRRLAASTGADASGVPEIDYVWTGQPYAELMPTRFSAIFSSHNIEHQPDLIRHFQELSDVLEPAGRLFFIIPDRRYCFDHYLPNTNFADVLGAFYDQRRKHNAASVFEHLLLTTHNDAARHWLGDHGPSPFDAPITPATIEAVQQTMNRIEVTPGYIDTHAWQFTPDSFRLLIELLQRAGLIRFEVERLYPTTRNAFEFYAILRRAKP